VAAVRVSVVAVEESVREGDQGRPEGRPLP